MISAWYKRHIKTRSDGVLTMQFPWKEWKPRKRIIRIPWILAEIWKRGFPITKQNAKQLTSTLGTVVEIVPFNVNICVVMYRWHHTAVRRSAKCSLVLLEVIFIIFLLHGLGRLTCSGTDALQSFPGASTISSSSTFVVEGVFRKSGVVHSFELVDPVLFVFGSHVLYSRDLQFFPYDFASYEGWNFNSGNYLFTTDTK